MSPSTQALPSYLRKYITEQKYDAYTSREHAAWRYIMRQNRAFFATHAVGVYLEGLKKTGISLTRIPRISDMDDCLAAFGWGAVPVRGFIPPAAFLDFQARAVLPIACDMRTVSHIAYTPAPDIVHEAAGHAPILAEPAYARYLHRYARMAQRAIASDEDIRQYEAIRYLSDIKENPDATAQQIEQAELRLKQVTAGMTGVSEAAKVARMAWWTVEYGLVGDLKAPRIYGAGLLSSVGESQNCLSDRVRKIPLTVDCVETSYDITEPQPQLFVTPDMGHLDRVLEDLEKTMAFVRGGEAGLDRAKRAKSVNTVVLDSGLEISGELTEYALGAGRQPVFLKFTGPVQLSHAGAQISGHGRARHGQGFSTPLGRWAATTRQPQNTLSDADLAKAGLIAGRTATLKFPSGITVSGTLAGWHRENHRLLFFTWRNCTVTQGDRTLFDPSWGEFDMAIGETVTSVYGGPADRFQFGDLDIGEATTSPARTTPYSTREISLFDVYRQIRGIRENGKDSAGLESLARRIASDFADEWLLAVEVLEIGQSRFGAKKPAWLGDLEKSLRETQRHADRTTAELIEKGLALLGQPD